jgi:hypothetical protein
MTKIQNNFLKATVNKDLDERLTPNGQMTDAVNVMAISEDSGNVGVLKNIKGNVKVTDFNIDNSETIGSISDESKERCFYFVTSSDYDYVIEYNTQSNETTIVLQSSYGGVLNFNRDYRISHSDIFTSVEGDDLLSWTDGFNPPRIINIERSKLYPIDGFTEDEISVMKPSPIFAPSINLISIDAETTSNFIEDKFLQFGYRYKYNDGYYSAISSWSQVAFLPSRFSLDYQTYENLGMVNLANAINVSFNVGSRDVIGVDLLFKESESSTVYIVDRFDKEKEGWTIENLNVSYQFIGNKIYGTLPESEYFRNFDNVPLKALAQKKVNNRLIFGNFTEGQDIDSDINLDVDYVSTPLVFEEKIGSIQSVIKPTLFSNLVDFERGNADGGSSPVDQMNYLTNTLNANISAYPSGSGYQITINITPKGAFSSTPYNLYIKEGATTITQFLNRTGNTTINTTFTTSRNLTFFLTSDFGLIYDLRLNYNISGVFSNSISRWVYYAEDQLAYPKSGGYTSTLEGDTVIRNKSSFDFTNFDFKSGSQFRFDFNTQSSLVFSVKPQFTFFYNLTSDYSNLSDFLLNSDFVYNFEETFSKSFVEGTNAFASNAGDRVSYTGFKITSSGETLTITNPHIVYSVTENNGVVENKNDFYLNNSVSFGLYGEDAFSSMHSNRDYNCDIIFLDDKGRKTTVISGGKTSLFIPAENSDLVNKVKVTTIGNPPSWAKYYKFAIKETKREYETIYGNIVYSEGVNRWIKVVGENKGKIKEGDELILKSDYSGVVDRPIKIKVIEIAEKTKDFIEGNILENGDDLIEESGLYFKIKQGAFNINIGVDSSRLFEGFGKRRYASRSFVSTSPLFGEKEDNVFIPTPVKAGTQIKFEVEVYAKGAIAFRETFSIDVFSTEDYDSVKDWWEAEVSNLDSWNKYVSDILSDYDWGETNDGSVFRVKPNRDGTASRDISVSISFNINFSGGTLIFENYKAEQLKAPYYESVETFVVNNGNYFSGNALEPNVHILSKTFNCFTFANGCESNAIKDALTSKRFYINSNPNDISEDVYRQVHRYADLTYSGVFQESTNVNRLNEFNLSLANYKDDLEKSYGPIVVLDSDGTDLLVVQEDRYSKVLYGKDLLYNADGTTNLSRIEDVLGQQVVYGGEYGISTHADSYDSYSTNSFATDTKRGAVIRLNDANGLYEVSLYGMRDYFKVLFRDSTILNIIGQYDSFFDIYLLNIKYKKKNKQYIPGDYDYVTWSFSNEAQGFLGLQTFNPDDMLRVNNDFLSFKGADVYKHNIGPYNEFYGVKTPSSFEFNFNEEPSVRKIFKNISIEGNSAWDVSLKTEMQSGYINKNDFKKKEGVYYGYVRGNDSLDLSAISVNGIGVVSNSVGSSITFSNEIPSIVSVGDLLYNESLVSLGEIQGIGDKSISTSGAVSIPIGTFLFSSKPSSVETSGIRGYYMNVKASLNSDEYSEVYALNSEAIKSFE